MSAHNHVFTRVCGFGLTVTPFAPYRIAQGAAGPMSLDIPYFASEGEIFARVLADGDGGYTSKIDQNTRSLYDVVEITWHESSAPWRIETSVFWCDWPDSYDLISTRFPEEATIVDLTGANGEGLYIQSAQQTPVLNTMVAPGQRVINVDEAAAVIDLQYWHAWRVWHQRHHIVPFPVHPLVVSVQAPRQHFRQACIDAYAVCQSITPFPEDQF